MQELEAYKDETRAVGPGALSVYVPAARLGEALALAMQQRSAGANGYYELDLIVVPLTGDAMADYTVGAMWGGDEWKLNLNALA